MYLVARCQLTSTPTYGPEKIVSNNGPYMTDYPGLIMNRGSYIGLYQLVQKGVVFETNTIQWEVRRGNLNDSVEFEGFVLLLLVKSSATTGRTDDEFIRLVQKLIQLLGLKV